MSENNVLDLANLGTQALAGTEGEYEAPSEFFRPPEPTAKGERETVTLAKEIEDKDFYGLKDFDTKEPIPGFSVNAQFEIKGGKQDGRKFFAFIDTRKKMNRNGNDVQDYLRSAGFTGRLVTMNDFRDAIKTHVGLAQVRLTWTGEKCQICGKSTVKKIGDFPLKADGTRNHVTTCPDCGEQVGARVKVAMFVVGKPTA